MKHLCYEMLSMKHLCCETLMYFIIYCKYVYVYEMIINDISNYNVLNRGDFLLLARCYIVKQNSNRLSKYA